ncbi:hypothetical protein MBLNU459_g0013t1 [Dothideomycetes sp. NU459]
MAIPGRGPKSVEEIVRDAQNFDHKTSYPLRIALRTAQNMLNQAANYERDGNLEDAYLFLYRHAEFYVSQISKHPDSKKPEFKLLVARVRDEVKADISRLETLQPELKRRYEKYQQSVRNRDAARQRIADQRTRSAEADNTTQPDLFSESRMLVAGEHKDLALRLAHRELRRRDASKHDDAAMDDLTQGIRAIGRQLDGSRSPSHEPSVARVSRFNYPKVPSARDGGRSDATHLTPGVAAPDLPPKTESATHSFAPPIPPKSAYENLGSSSPPAAPAPPPKEELSSADYTFKPAAYTESGMPLRTLFLPTELRTQFLALASSNTRNNLETCGILCGTLISSALFISHLVIPDQMSTSDTCETTDEGENALFDYVDGEELMVFGWIHTHPTQTCFLSSRDLHTSVGYQVMLPESVAIVCAPSKTPE